MWKCECLQIVYKIYKFSAPKRAADCNSFNTISWNLNHLSSDISSEIILDAAVRIFASASFMKSAPLISLNLSLIDFLLKALFLFLLI